MRAPRYIFVSFPRDIAFLLVENAIFVGMQLHNLRLFVASVGGYLIGILLTAWRQTTRVAIRYHAFTV